MSVLRIIGMKAIATGPRLSPIALITGACVAHMKLVVTISSQSEYFLSLVIVNRFRRRVGGTDQSLHNDLARALPSDGDGVITLAEIPQRVALRVQLDPR